MPTNTLQKKSSAANSQEAPHTTPAERSTALTKDWKGRGMQGGWYLGITLCEQLCS